MATVERWIEITFVLIVLYLVLTNSDGFSSAVRSLGSVYTQSVRALQGR
jgi:hypothetical protein